MKRIAAILLALILLPAAQAQDSSLSGQVLDQDGNPVAGADVYLNQWSYQEPEPAGEGGGETCDPDGACKAESEPYYEGQHHNAQAKTDSQGRFTLKAIQGEGWMSVSKQGYAGTSQSVKVDGATVMDLEMLKYPDKTAHIEGKISSGGQPVRYASISIENPEYGVHECSYIEGDGEPGTSSSSSTSGSSSGTVSMAAEEDMATDEEVARSSMIAPDYYGCSIQLNADGTFSGDVTPGYSIVRVYVQSWRDSDRVEYYSLSRVVTLAADSTTNLDLQLTAKPGPDAKLKGYVIDTTTQKAVPGAQVSFSNQDSYGWANAKTDKDGSYHVAVRSGMTQISVWAEGFFPWEGQVVLVAGDDRRVDIFVTPGESQYGYCCYAYDGDVRTMTAESAAGSGSSGAASSTSSGGGLDSDAGGKSLTAGDDAAEEGERDVAFEDLGGGLGPYDPQQAQADELEQQSPGFEVAFILAALAAIVMVRRR